MKSITDNEKQLFEDLKKAVEGQGYEMDEHTIGMEISNAYIRFIGKSKKERQEVIDAYTQCYTMLKKFTPHIIDSEDMQKITNQFMDVYYG